MKEELEPRWSKKSSVFRTYIKFRGFLDQKNHLESWGSNRKNQQAKTGMNSKIIFSDLFYYL